jgi:predicted ATPase/DNA-binding CsgD family transcriptional regulator
MSQVQSPASITAGLLKIKMGLTNLPIQLTSFVGRKREITDVKRLLLRSRLITLTGTSGCGKTRLANQIANSLSESFADGVWFVDLASLHEPDLVSQLVSLVLGLRPIADQPLLEVLQRFLQSKQLLLILDNCEHLLETCALLAQELLSTTSNLRILATSREPLAIAGESIYPIAGLTWPAITSGVEANPSELMQHDAVRLFVERARTISPNFNLTSENFLSIIEICQRLDGLPLALELASTRVNVLTVQEVTSRLNNRLALLISGESIGLEPRHQTLRAAIDWSYTLLPVDEQILLRRMAIFEAGCTFDTIEAICTDEESTPEITLDQISSLVSKSLVVAETIGRTQARYRLLETIHEYALEKLEEAGEITRLRDRHLDLFLTRAEEAAPKLNDTYQQLWLNWFEGEIDNLRAALAWSLKSGRIESGLRLASALTRFWEIRGYVNEGLTWFKRLLIQSDERISLVAHANALVNASFLAMFIGDAATSLSYGQKAIDLADGAGDQRSEIIIMALAGLASGARISGDLTTAFSNEEQIIQLLHKSPRQPFFLGMSLLAHGGTAIELGDYETARSSLDESLAIAKEAGDSFRIANALNSIGDLARCEQRYADAQIAYENSATFMREVSAQRDLASVLHNYGHTCLHLGNIDRARVLFDESLATHQLLHNLPGVAECMIGFAATAFFYGSPAAGARLLGASTAIGGQKNTNAYMRNLTRIEYEHYLDLVRTKLSPEEFQAEQALGSSMTLEQAIDYARKLPLEQKEATTDSREIQDGLTKRELEIARLIGQGKTNGEIATELVLSKRTVETHVAHILSKMGLSSRSQVMRRVIDHELT